MKKTISLILVLILFTVSLWTDISAESVYGEGERLLFALGILDESSYSADSAVTRGDFAAAVAKTIGLSDMMQNCDTAFSDVTAKSKNSGAVKLLSDMGVIEGYGDGTFGEGDTLKKEQAVKIIMASLGYGVMCSAYGGYPSGYLVCAATAGLLKKTTVGDYAECKWSDAANLLYNALTVDIVKEENGEQKTQAGINALNTYHDVKKCEGIISGNDITSFTGAPQWAEHVQIGEEIFYDPDDLCAKLFGMRAEAYYKEEFGKNRLVLVKGGDINTEISVEASEIDGSSTAQQLCRYDKDNVLKKTNIKSGAVVIYNGKYLGRALTDDDLKFDFGSVRLIDNSGDKTADVVFIEKAEIYVVENINTTRLTIDDMYNMPQLSLDTDKQAFGYRVLWNGVEVPFDEIVQGSVLSVLKSLDNLYVEIHICADRVRGTVTEKNADSIFVDGVSYDILKGCESRVSDIPIGGSAMFYLTEHGKIAGSGTPDLAGKYGYLIETGPLGSSMAEKDKGVFRIFSLDDGTIKNYESASDIILNTGGTDDAARPSGKEISDKLLDGGRVKRQLIKYELNQEGKISKLYTAKKNTSNPKGYDDDVFSLDFDYPDTNNPMPGWNYLIYSDCGIISNRYLTAGALCLNVPAENSDGSINENNFYMFNINEYADSETISKFKVYDSDESRNIGVFVLEGGKGGQMPADELFIVDSFGEAVTEDGYIVERLYGYEKGVYTGYNISTASSMTAAEKALCKGDAVKLVKDETGILSIVKLFAVDPGNAKGSYKITGKYYDDWVKYLASTEYVRNSSSYWHQKSVVLHARPTFASKSTLLISFENGAPDKVLPLTASTKIVVYDVANKEFSPGTWEDIDANNKRQTVVLQVSYQEALDILIINWDKNTEPLWRGSYNN